MGSYTFRWDHSAEEVYVTGTFDNWKKTVRLDKTHYGFERDVNLPDATQKILYKFVADGVWLHDHTGKTETDHEGNVNNVLYPQDIKPPNSMAYQFSSVAPGATTADLAGQQPLEKQTSNPVPEDKGGLSGAVAGAAAGAGAVAASAAAAAGLSSGKNKENEKEQQFSVNPIPASAGAGNPIQLAPGQQVPDPSTINNNTVSSTAHDDPSLKAGAKDSDQTFGVSPLPATGGIGNPVSLQPGQKVPDSSSLTSNTITSNVKLDQASYENSGSGAPQLPPVASPASESAGGSLGGAALFGGLGPQTSNMIPESSLGMGKDVPPPIDRAFSQEDSGPTLSSAAPTSTTAALAGQVPKEPRGVPEVVTESQKEAHVGPEAAANPEAVLEKKQVENELKEKIPEEPAAKSDHAGAIAGGVLGGAAAGGLGAAVISSVAPTSTTNNLAGQVPKETRGVPEVVSESQEKAHVSPEAAANPEAVQEKKDVETELKAKVPEEPASTSNNNNNGVTGAVAGGLAAAGAAVAGGAAYAAKKTHETTGTDPTKVLPESIQQKIKEQNSQSSTTSGLASTSPVPAQKALGEGITPISNGTGATTADAVPAEVQASQKEAHVSPEAAANAEAVHEKSDVEKELLNKVPESQATGEPAPTVAAATSATAPGATAGTTSSGAPQLGAVGGLAPISMEEKPKDGLNASASSQAQAPVGVQAKKTQDSRDVSPMSKPAATNIADQTSPVVTTGVGSSEIPQKDVATAAAQTAVSKPIGTPRTPQTNPSTPQKRNSILGRFGKGTPDSSHGTPDSAEGSAKRKSFFSKLKEKLKN